MIRRPAGLISWRYASPWALRDPLVAIHRRLWLANRTRGWQIAWLAREMMRWGMWRTFRLPAMLRRMSGDARTGEIARRWAIPPYEVERHGLADRPEAMLSLVYDVETTAFHHLRNGDTVEVRRAMRLLADKVDAGAACASAGIPVAPVAAVVPQDSVALLQGEVGKLGACHCKARSGHGGRGAFAAWRTEAGLAGRRMDGTLLETAEQVETAWRELLANGDALVQPLLETHQSLAPMAAPGELVTLRFISERVGDGFAPFFAMLEVPLPNCVDHDWQTAPLPVDRTSGTLLPWPAAADYVTGAADVIASLRARAPAATRVPCYADIVLRSCAAHALVPTLWAVAWDWAITPAGPLLLEGNAAWSLAMPQILRDAPMAQLLLRDRPLASD